MKFLPRSLTFRIIALSSIWAVVALVVIATIISTLFRQASERGFTSLLSAHLFNLVGAVSVNDEGQLAGAPNLGDLRFTIPQSGWYWEVDPVSDGLSGQLRSLSLSDAIPAPATGEVPFDAQFQRSYVTTGLDDESIEVLEAEFVLDDQNRIARFRIMGNRTELEQDIDAFNRQVYTYLSLFGLGLIAINAVAILFGLQPLGRVRRALEEIRNGTATRLGGSFPSEIAPLANEANALMESNRRIVERARTQVGNLAHSLKTPLAVLMNESHAIGGDRGRLIADQAGAMRQQLDHYLQRARIAAQRDSVVFRTPVNETLARMVRVVGKINPEKSMVFETAGEEIVFAGEKEDFEEITGNLLENAMKWAGSEVRVALSPPARPIDKDSFFEILIEDDGPGIPEEQAREALRRGKRLDETKPGTGLGLAIVSDLVGEYGGRLSLDRSRLGGLRVRVALRAAME